MNNIIFKTTLKEPLKASKGNKTAQKATNQSLTNLFNNHQPNHSANPFNRTMTHIHLYSNH